MKDKHLKARIAQCLAIAECSSCSRRKFGAVLVDPERNVVIADGYNGPPRGAEGSGCVSSNPTLRHLSKCGLSLCLRDGLEPDDVVVVGPNGVDDHDIEDAWVKVKGFGIGIPFTMTTADGGTYLAWKPHGWRDEALAWRDKLLETFPSIPSGSRIEVGCHHAEMNVLCNAAANGTSTRGAWLIVTGEPCLMCAKLLHHAGIARVLCVRNGYAGGDAGVVYLQSVGVGVEYVDGPADPRSVNV